MRVRIRNAADIADFLEWQEAHFQEVRLYRSREQLWSELVARAENGPSRTVLEFGVAWGYATEWWLRAVPDQGLVWHGFDRFTGLPRAWRRLTEGAFDAQGLPPDLDDPRITWHVGDVEDTLGELSMSELSQRPLVVLFDLDLYEPTAAAWRRLEPVLKGGDLIYFDEAMDEDERKVLEELVLPSGRVRYIGSTPSALALEVTA